MQLIADKRFESINIAAHWEIDFETLRCLYVRMASAVAPSATARPVVDVTAATSSYSGLKHIVAFYLPPLDVGLSPRYPFDVGPQLKR